MISARIEPFHWVYRHLTWGSPWYLGTTSFEPLLTQPTGHTKTQTNEQETILSTHNYSRTGRPRTTITQWKISSYIFVLQRILESTKSEKCDEWPVTEQFWRSIWLTVFILLNRYKQERMSWGICRLEKKMNKEEREGTKDQWSHRQEKLRGVISQIGRRQTWEGWYHRYVPTSGGSRTLKLGRLRWDWDIFPRTIGRVAAAHGLWPCWGWVREGVAPSRNGGPGCHPRIFFLLSLAVDEFWCV